MLTASLAAGDTTEPAKDQTIDPTIQALADSENAFALKLYSQLRASDGNLFISPYSIDSALMMVRAGAAGPTADEMTKTLNLADINGADPNAAMSALSGRFSASAKDSGYELHVANAMWGQEGGGFLPAYLAQLQQNFAAELNTVDFHAPGAAAATINNWVTLKTSGRIKDLISAGALNDRTKLILTNAIYFKGDWQQPFKQRSTHDAQWNDGTAKATAPTTERGGTVPMMFQSSGFDYAKVDGEKGDGFAALQMPYKGGAGDDHLAMLVLLPDDPATGLASLEQSLDADRLKDIVSKLAHQHKVEVSFPKFKLETKYEMSRTLAAMGMPTVFSSSADLSGIDGKHDLFVTGVVHQAFVQVDETGTEAAGATGVMVRALAMRQRLVFNADHPFIFAIRDVKTGTILFIGRVVHPES
jgi:serpin B